MGKTLDVIHVDTIAPVLQTHESPDALLIQIKHFKTDKKKAQLTYWNYFSSGGWWVFLLHSPLLICREYNTCPIASNLQVLHYMVDVYSIFNIDLQEQRSTQTI